MSTSFSRRGEFGSEPMANLTVTLVHDLLLLLVNIFLVIAE